MDVELAPATCCLFDQCCNSFWQPLPQAEWVKVSDRKPDMFDVTTLLATGNDGVDVQIKVGHVRVFLKTEDCAHAHISKPTEKLTSTLLLGFTLGACHRQRMYLSTSAAV